MIGGQIIWNPSKNLKCKLFHFCYVQAGIFAFKQLGDELFKSGLGDFLKSMADRLTAMANAIAKANRAARGE